MTEAIAEEAETSAVVQSFLEMLEREHQCAAVQDLSQSTRQSTEVPSMSVVGEKSLVPVGGHSAAQVCTLFSPIYSCIGAGCHITLDSPPTILCVAYTPFPLSCCAFARRTARGPHIPIFNWYQSLVTCIGCLLGNNLVMEAMEHDSKQCGQAWHNLVATMEAWIGGRLSHFTLIVCRILS